MKAKILLFPLTLLLSCSTAFAATLCDKLSGSWQGEGRYISPGLTYVFDAVATASRENDHFRMEYTVHGEVENGRSYSYILECENGFLSINEGPVQGEGAFTGTKLVLKIFNGTGYTFLRLK
ncbi:hypothetical protein Lbir_0047 [Legionella birminghamensis]|uniref:Secreted protein n=1 Tax=Legionella birminghamensis TaxID=28083 RepID=A0A378IIV7_9GAMM|nr:hypothetical protein [Legionella birminghamensis]KTC75978.1 hypothetical protein Lbir_0047 [Legionella birminghamensis]STX32104.1 Uncharacterised protein [Legionella birminghamensis]